MNLTQKVIMVDAFFIYGIDPIHVIIFGNFCVKSQRSIVTGPDVTAKNVASLIHRHFCHKFLALGRKQIYSINIITKCLRHFLRGALLVLKGLWYRRSWPIFFRKFWLNSSWKVWKISEILRGIPWAYWKFCTIIISPDNYIRFSKFTYKFSHGKNWDLYLL